MLYSAPTSDGVALSTAGSATSLHRRPAAFYSVLLLGLTVVQVSSLFAYLDGGSLIRASIPAYTHLLSLTVGTLFLFRGLQLLGALLWVHLFGTPAPPRVLDRDAEDLPKVTVQIPVRHEPLDVARVAIDSAFALDYPAEALEIQVIDNSDCPEHYQPIEEYLETKQAEAGEHSPRVSFLHRSGTQGFKAGNLNLGLQQAAETSFSSSTLTRAFLRTLY